MNNIRDELFGLSYPTSGNPDISQQLSNAWKGISNDEKKENIPIDIKEKPQRTRKK